MESIDRIKAHYRLSPEDVENLQRLRPIMEGYKEEFPGKFYNYIKVFEETPKFLQDEETIKRHQDGLKKWFINLFSGEYDTDYIKNLEKIGYAHVKIGLNAHYVNSAMNFVRGYCQDIIEKEFKDTLELRKIVRSIEKILDINLDIMTSSYIEEELKMYFLSPRVESYLIHFANRFSYGMNLLLVIGLVIMGLMVIGLFAYDITHILTGDIEKGLLSTLGTLLMLWVVIELMDTEIKHLRGGKFAIKVFISVALVAVIRKILVTTIGKEEVIGTQLSLIVGVAVLGFIYWLVSRAEKE